MEQLPTLKEVLSFLKEHIKIIIFTMIAGIIFYGIGIGYTLYSDAKVTSNEINKSENIDSEELFLSQKELDKLQKNIVSFSFYVENEDATPFVNYNLLKELLTTMDVQDLIQERAGITVEPSLNQAVNIILDRESNLLKISIGTGNYKSNKSIAYAYYNAMKDGDIQFFDNKSVNLLSVPTENKKDAIVAEGTTNIENTTISSKKIIIFGFLAILFSVILGIIIAIVYSLTRKEITDTFTYAFEEEDRIVDFSTLNSGSRDEKIVHAIIHPKSTTKLVLLETLLNIEITNLLQTKSKEASHELDEQPPTILVANDMLEVNPLIQIDEVIILIKKKETTKKKWYRNQRIQLGNYAAPVKVIQI